MIGKSIIMILIVYIFSFNSKIETEKGRGISDDQLAHINQIIAIGRQKYVRSLYDLAVYIKGEIQITYNQYWLVEIVSGTNLTFGVYQEVYVNDQWLKLIKQNGNIFYWISVPASTRFHHYGFSLKNTFADQKIKENHRKPMILGSGISPSQEIAIKNIIQNAQLSKGKNPQACANVIGQKLEDSDGQNWVVEIYGCDKHDINWGRFELKYDNQQRLSYENYGNYKWQYFIWVPKY